jgi:hypothetical protein
MSKPAGSMIRFCLGKARRLTFPGLKPWAVFRSSFGRLKYAQENVQTAGAFGADEPGRLRLLQSAVRVAQHDRDRVRVGGGHVLRQLASSTPRSIRTLCFSTAVRRRRSPIRPLLRFSSFWR